MKQYVAKYFLKTSQILGKFSPNNIITMQFFQRHNNAILCGINEVLDFLKKHTNVTNYKIKYLKEGSVIQAYEVVLELEGKYEDFGIYEGVIDGILTRSTSLASNAYHLKQVTNKKIIFMGDRADHYLNQTRDGYAISIGGIKTQVTSAHIKLHNGNAVGTIPHVLIQAFKGNLNKTLSFYRRTFPNEKIVALVDFNNDVLKETLSALKIFKNQLQAIRIDTASNLRDKMFSASENQYGVTPKMIKIVRKNLDENNGKHVQIIISSGLNINRIKQFELESAPVDIYGVGASLLKINHFFTADAVKLNGVEIAKFGRKYRHNKKLIAY